MRKIISLSDKWLFHNGDILLKIPRDKGPVYSQSKTQRKLIGPAAYKYVDSPNMYSTEAILNNEKWEYIDIPHDYIINQDNDSSENGALGYFKYTNAWYRKHFTLNENEDDNKRILLQFEGISGKSTIYLNGCLMYHNFSSYNSFEIDISNNVYYGKENVIAIYVNTEEFEGWWYQGGGIYRDVNLVITDSVAIDRYGVYAPVYKMNDTDWEMKLQTTVVNDSYTEKNIELESSVLNSRGFTVSKIKCTGIIPLREKKIFNYNTVVNNPKLWDTDNPNLYKVKTILKVDGVEIDCNYVNIGFRTVVADPQKGLFINGVHTVLKGVCSHQDFGLTGIAVPDNIARYKIKMFKEMGANAFRTTHYMNSSYNMDCFDELGFLVMDETRWFETSPEAKEQLQSLVKRDRNRPSVIFWSTGNEEPYHASSVGRRIHKSMAEEIRKLDDTRFITAAEDKTPDKSFIFDDCDVIGINYNLGLFDTIHEQKPNLPVFSSECCATGTTRDWFLSTNSSGRVMDKDTDSNSWFRSREYTWKFLMSRPYIMGGFQWAAVDHRGEAEWPMICSKSGAIDLFLQKKGAFYQNQSLWESKPMVHIVSHWNRKGLEGKSVPVIVYSNCDTLELFLNGESMGRKIIEQYSHGEWNVIYKQGELLVKGYKNGLLVAEDKKITTKSAVKLNLRLLNNVLANGKDYALFNCECIDVDGNTVPDATEYVKFSVASPAKIVATGSDNCDHTNVCNNERKMYAGKISVLVKPAINQEFIELFAQSDNCGISQIKVDLKNK